MQTLTGQDIKGELLAVKGNTLILLDLVTSEGIEVEIDTIRHIRIVRRSQILRGMGKSLLIGAGSGALLGFLSGDDSGGWFSMTAEEKALAGAIGLGILSLPIGGILGALNGSDTSITLETRSSEDIQAILTKLSTKARSPTYFPKDIKSMLHPDNPKEQKFKKKYRDTLNRIQAKNSNRTISAKSYKKLHISYTPTFFLALETENHAELFNKIGFGDTRPGWLGLDPIYYPRVQKKSIFKPTNFNIEFSFSNNIAVGFGYTTIGLHETRGHKKVMLDLNKWGYQDYSDLYITSEYSGNMYYITGAWKTIPDGSLKRESVELGVGLGISLIDLNYLTTPNSYNEDRAENFQAKKLEPLLIVFAEYDYYIGNSWSIGLKIDYKHSNTNIESFQLKGNYIEWDENRNRNFSSLLIDIPEHKINISGLGFGFSLSLHF